MIENMQPKEIIAGLMERAQHFYGQTAKEDGQAVVAFNPQEGIVEPGVYLFAPEHFVTLPIKNFNEPQYNIETARAVLYPQIKEKCI